MRFLAKMESLMSEGKGDEVCAMFHDDLEVDIADHSGEATQNVSGGKAGVLRTHQRRPSPACSCCRIR